MKFLCNTEFFHSGSNRLFAAGTVYSDITAKTAGELIAADEKLPLGALSFFTPVDEEAVNFVKAKKGDETTPAGGVTTPKQPSKAELTAEAKNLGIKGADKMNVEELKQAVAAAQAGGATTTVGGETPPTETPQE